jgi:hypothetical protein
MQKLGQILFPVSDDEFLPKWNARPKLPRRFTNDFVTKAQLMTIFHGLVGHGGVSMLLITKHFAGVKTFFILAPLHYHTKY